MGVCVWRQGSESGDRSSRTSSGRLRPGLGEHVGNGPGEAVSHVRTRVGEHGTVFDVIATVGETTEQSERDLACCVVETQRGSRKIVELRL